MYVTRALAVCLCVCVVMKAKNGRVYVYARSNEHYRCVQLHRAGRFHIEMHGFQKMQKKLCKSASRNRDSYVKGQLWACHTFGISVT